MDFMAGEYWLLSLEDAKDRIELDAAATMNNAPQRPGVSSPGEVSLRGSAPEPLPERNLYLWTEMARSGT
jgi:hypothetical protein